MNRIITQLLTSFTSRLEESNSNSSTESLKNAFRSVLRSPIFYIVIGAIILLIVAVYLVRRVVKPRPNTVTIVVRKGSIHKLIYEKSAYYFRAPFIDKVGAVISLSEKELTSDKLFINNGPDALYQINYTLKYKVIDSKEFYKFHNNIQDIIIKRLNDDLREFADKGNALILVKEYRENNEKILKLINSSINQYSIEAISFKINLIQPLGR